MPQSHSHNDSRLKRNSGAIGETREFHSYLLVVVVEPEVVPPVVSEPSCLHPTSAKQATSVSNAISFIVELLLFPYCERPGLLGQAGPYEADSYPLFQTCQALFSPTPCSHQAHGGEHSFIEGPHHIPF